MHEEPKQTPEPKPMGAFGYSMSIFFMALPFVLGSMAWLFQNSNSGSILLGFWLLATVACLGWGFLIRRRSVYLTWACVGVGVLHFAVILVVPLLAYRKSF